MQIINSFKRKAFTLVEMLVALAVGAIVIMATYASYEMVNTQYRKNIDIANMHTSGRSIMQIIERDVRMAGFEYRHTSGTNKGKKAFSGSITTPLDIKDSGNKCCDEVTVVYDHAQDVLDWKGRVVSNKVERIRVRYWAEIHLSNKGNRHRLYKQKDILGQNQKILAKPKLGNKEVMADYIEDLQLVNTVRLSDLYIGSNSGIVTIYNPTTKKNIGWFDNKINGRSSRYQIDALAFKNKKIGKISLVSIILVLRTKNQYGKDRQFKKKDYQSGNFKLDKTDKYKRDTFSTTVLVRNLAL